MILALSGLSKAGKSTLARELALKLEWPTLGFGNYVRHIAKTQGVGAEFSALQSLGQSMVDADPASFVNSVFDFGGLSPSDDVILDGLRHMEVLTALENYVRPEPVSVVLLHVDREVLVERYQRAGLNESTVLEGPAEQQVQNVLVEKASLVIDGTQPTSQAVREVVELLARTR